MISYIIWNGSPEIFSFESFALRWYGLLFALGFLISQQIMYYFFRQEGRPEKHVDTLTIYMVVATILGARLGHVIFYQPELFVTDPLSILLPFEFSPFRFTGLQGLASHGAAIGILFALWLFSRRKEHNMSYLQTVDRIVIVVALTGALIRLGNFFNSEIVGLPSNNPLSVVFVNKITEGLMDNPRGANPVETIKVEKNKSLPEGANGRVPIYLYVIFKKGTSQLQAASYMDGEVKHYLTYFNEFVDEPTTTPLNYQIDTEPSGSIAARASTFGIARHPAQLYEAISCVVLFVLLFLMWQKDKINSPPGRIFGVFMIILWSLRFVYEFLKENQVDFEDKLPLNMGQILSIPMVLAGIFILIWSYRNQSKKQA
ncbi:MAG: prolipoprotein diacylglyceryl transferase [Cyclobacteriaceae bacterium]|nr:prolipoprotein diacylglyceryl transferase [Cyclobacteriaceae bacterium]